MADKCLLDYAAPQVGTVYYKGDWFMAATLNLGL